MIYGGLQAEFSKSKHNGYIHRYGPPVFGSIALRPIHWSQVFSREWRCSWSSADRRCSNYIWVINIFIDYWGAAYNRCLMEILMGHCGICALLKSLQLPIGGYMFRQSPVFSNSPREARDIVSNVDGLNPSVPCKEVACQLMLPRRRVANKHTVDWLLVSS